MTIKTFFKRPFFHLAGKIAKKMQDFQRNENAKREKKSDNLWYKKFIEKDFFQFNLNHDVKINLYKDSVLSRLIYDGFEKQETNYLTTVLKSGDVFIDIGANIGLFSLLASKLVGEEGKVICFEPSLDVFSRLEENILSNNFTNIDCRNIGLSDKEGELTFYTSKNGHDAWNSFAPSQDDKLEKEIKVEVSTLDSELSDINKALIKLVKIDVEGWEKFVLNGGRDFFVNFNPIVMVEFTEENTFNAGYSVYEIYDLMQSWGYSWYRIIDGKLVREVKKMRYPYANLIAKKENQMLSNNENE